MYQPIHDGEEVDSIAVVAVDVTELAVARRQAELADRTKDEFIALLSHELRNPLAPLSAGLEVMKSLSADSPQFAEIRDTLDRQVQQLTTLVDDLLEVSHITRGKLKLHKQRMSLAEIVRDSLETVKPHIDAAGHELTTDLPEQPIEVYADPHRLAQVLSNVLNNAAKYTPNGGRISLTVKRQQDEAVLTVKDTGVGISAEDQARIFDIFAQIEQPIHGPSGLGIGLTLVKRLLDRHDGDVVVRSEGPGQGSEFEIRLPVAAGEQPPHESTAEAKPDDDAVSVRRVLIADDNKQAAEMLGMLIKTFRHNVRLAYDGQQAVDIAEQFRPDVILMDLGMPQMDGYEASRRIRAQPWGASTVIVALTGWGQGQDQERTKAAGFDRHLVKPARLADLQQLLADLK